MRKTICGIDCEKYEACGTCRGCSETGGRPFDGECIVADETYLMAAEYGECGAEAEIVVFKRWNS